jgi:hypothetical protein
VKPVLGDAKKLAAPKLSAACLQPRVSLSTSSALNPAGFVVEHVPLTGLPFAAKADCQVSPTFRQAFDNGGTGLTGGAGCLAAPVPAVTPSKIAAVTTQIRIGNR